jgi:hypothetical protein
LSKIERERENSRPMPYTLKVEDRMLRTIYYHPYPITKCPCDKMDKYPECVAKFGNCKKD